jgi:2-polyprenyl-3-methyl-5-hydroxy-6-metoxy-1,4-benzoquinol methylase
MPFGSIFSKFETFEAETADGKKIYLRNNFINKIGLKILGMPHIGLRLRARKIVKNLPKKINRMLDAGCGTGIYSFSLANRVNQINAIDISEEKIKYLKKENIFKNVIFEKEDLCSLKFKNNSFDIIICSDVLEHIKEDNLALSELTRVLNKNNEMILTLPFDSTKNRSCYKKYGHERAGYDLDNIKKISKKLNLKIIDYEYYSYPLGDKISELSYNLIKKPILLAIFFYPLYWISILVDNLKIGEPNGIFVKLRKVNILPHKL